MTNVIPTPIPADPVEGEPGHFDHTLWVKEALLALDGAVVRKSGDIMTGPLTTAEVVVDPPANSDSTIQMRGSGFRGVIGQSSAGLLRWFMMLGDNAGEGGANAGSLFSLWAYDDTGNPMHQVLKASRVDGLVEVKASPTAPKGVATKEYVDNSMPIGAIIAYGGSVAPTGWHMCNGTAHGSAALQALIGSANTPDLSGRFIVGSGTGYNPGATGGVASNTLTPAQTATKGHSHTGTANSTDTNHTHDIDPPLTWSSGHNQDHSHYTSMGGGGHSHGAAYANNWQGSLMAQNPSGDDYAPIGNGPSQFGATSTAGDHSHAGQSGGASVDHAHYVDIGAFGSGWKNHNAAHTHGLTVNATVDANATASIENRPPYYALVYIIKKV